MEDFANGSREIPTFRVLCYVIQSCVRSALRSDAVALIGNN